MKFFDDIKNQSQQMREIMFGLAVFITVLLIGIVWFRSFQKNLYVLMNPEEDAEKALAVESISTPSLFGFILQTAGNVGAAVSELFEANKQQPHPSLKATEGKATSNNQQQAEEGRVYTLPLSDYK